MVTVYVITYEDPSNMGTQEYIGIAATPDDAEDRIIADINEQNGETSRGDYTIEAEYLR